MKKETKTPKVPDTQKTIETVLAELFQLLDLKTDYAITLNEDGTAEVVLETEDSGIVIGYHGETLEALGLIVSLSVSKKIGTFVRVTFDVGDYKKNRTDALSTLVAETKEKVIAENKEFSLPNLRSWERRVVHTMLQDDSEVTTESIGEGRERTLIIKPREQ